MNPDGDAHFSLRLNDLMDLCGNKAPLITLALSRCNVWIAKPEDEEVNWSPKITNADFGRWSEQKQQ